MADVALVYGYGLALLALAAAAIAYLLWLKRRLRAAQQRLLDVTRQLEETKRVLQQRSMLDGLTGVANRHLFVETLTREWARAIRRAEPLALLMVDIDFFKLHNDRYGHQAGDECLRQVAATLRAALQRPGDLVARYGGEEFAVILPGTDAAGAAVVAERLRLAVAALKLPHVNAVTGHDVTVSVGVASMVPSASSRPEALVAAADQALYQAKAVGRNQVIVAPMPPAAGR